MIFDFFFLKSGNISKARFWASGREFCRRRRLRRSRREKNIGGGVVVVVVMMLAFFSLVQRLVSLRRSY